MTDTEKKAAGEAAIAYKKNVCQAYIALTPDQIDSKVAGSAFNVSRKYDGFLALLFWNRKEVFAANSSGTILEALLCFDEAAAAFKKAKLQAAVIPAEIYAEESSGRSRVFDAVGALADKAKQKSLRAAAFDIVSLDGQPFKASSWDATYEKLSGIFGSGDLVKPVQAQKAANKEELKKLFEEWVASEDAEGMVVRSELPLVYKIKPKYSIDAVVVGFTVGVPLSVSGGKLGGTGADEVRTLLFALMDEDGKYQIIGHAGNGVDKEDKKALCERLLKLKIASRYIETDSNHTAFHMIRPEIVAEFSANDALFENSSGPIINQKLAVQDNEYRRVGAVPGISLVSPVFERFRDDKKAEPGDVRVSQISDVFYNPYAAGKSAETEDLPKSKLLKREVYKKESGSKLMVLKFLLWKTNKEKAGYPAYVCTCLNFSSERAEPLTQDMRISNDEAQIQELYAGFIEKNVKKGWEKV